MTTGGAGVRIAVVDTGIVAHADLNANVLPGYDVVSDVAIANDGDGRDADPADAGDWITTSEAASGFFAGCNVGGSSCHGSHVAGTIAAATNNTIGVAGSTGRPRSSRFVCSANVAATPATSPTASAGRQAYWCPVRQRTSIPRASST